MQHAQQRALAATVGPDQRHPLTAVHSQVNATQCDVRAKRHIDLLQAEQTGL
jgi:hypothetical protein